MWGYIVRRSVQAVAVCFAISILTFTLLFLSTDPAVILLPPDADHQMLEEFRKTMGLDRPIIVQYADFISGVLLRADFGESFVAGIPAIDVLGQHAGATVRLALVSLLLTTVVSVAIGIVAAVRQYSFVDNLATFLALMGQAMPLFWLGIMLIIIFGVQLRWLPTAGSDTGWHIILPAVTIAWYLMPINMRLVRSGMLEVLTQDYIRTARAKGLPERLVIMKHALRNAVIPLVTVMGLQFGALLGGGVVVETVFSWPGLGRLAVDSIRVGDYPVVQAVVIVFSVVVVLGNLIADIAAAYLDPRIRLE